MVNAFSIDIRKLVLMLMPTALRKPILYHLVFRMVTPFVGIYRAFYQRRLNNLFFASYDSGKGNIERMLNIRFFGEYVVGGSNPITITNTTDAETEFEGLYITTNVESDSAFVGDGYIDAEIPLQLFKVRIPRTLEQQLVVDMVNKYILPGIGFKIEVYG